MTKRLMNVIRIGIGAIVIAGCSLRQSYHCASAIEPFVDDFRGYHPKVDNIIITFDVLDDTKLGECEHGGFTPKVRLNITKWRGRTYWQKRVLVFHELGHCVLNKRHDDTFLNIMNTINLGDYNENTYLYYDDILFNR